MRITHLRVITAIVTFLIINGNVFAQLQTGSLTNITLSIDDTTAGEETIYTFNFTTSANGNGIEKGIPDNGKLKFTFPTGFNVSQVSIVHSKNGSINGGFSSIQKNGQQIIITRDGTGDTVNISTSVSISIGNVINDTTVANDFLIDIQTMTNSDTPIDSGKTPLFSISPADLDHFYLSISGNDVQAGQNYTVTIYAKDVYENNVTNFNKNVTLSDITGTINPNLVSFTNGKWTNDVKFTKAIYSNKITANYANKTGTSIVFNVIPGSTHYIKIIEGTSGHGEEFGTDALTTDQTLTLHTSGYDMYGNYTEDKKSHWSMIGQDIGDFDNTFAYIVHFNAITPGSGRIYASYSPTVEPDTTDFIIVTVGTLHHIKILTSSNGETSVQDTVTLDVGDNLIVHAGGYDADDNYIDDRSVNWYVIGGIGTINQGPSISSQFNATQIGQGNIKAVHVIAGNTYTGLITVNKGPIDHIILQTEPGDGGVPLGDYIMTSDDSLVIFAEGYDMGSNYIGSINIDWFQLPGGGLQPDMSASNTSTLVFKPTGARVNGKIVGVYTTDIRDTTGMVTVNPGVPTGIFTLTLEKDELSANGSDSTVITSSVIFDGDNNQIAENEMFTVSLSPKNLGVKIINPLDADNNINNGYQVKSNNYGKISFTIQAGEKGGTAFISANSVNGTAYGDTTVLLSAIRIISISADEEKVSQGQDSIDVRMLVNNPGDVTIAVQKALLKFNGPSEEDWTGDYVVSSISNFSIDSGDTTLNFMVKVKNTAHSGAITLNGEIDGYAGGTIYVKDTSADITDSWIVQTPPQLSIMKIIAVDDTVRQGTKANVSMIVKNNGMAPALITSDSITFRLNREPSTNLTHEYAQTPDYYNPSLINEGEQVTLNYSISVGINSTKDEIKLDGKIFAKDIRTGLFVSDTEAQEKDTWIVIPSGGISIYDIYPSQVYVTMGQVTPWTITIKVKNNFDTTTVSLDSAKLEFFSIGPDTAITDEYSVSFDTIFKETNNTTLFADSTETLEFIINETGTTMGWVKIVVTVYLNDSTSEPIIVGRQTKINVQSPSALFITDVQPSQHEVTTGQQNNWQIGVTVKNIGTSGIIICFSSDSTYIKFSTGDDFGVTIEDDSLFVASGATENFFFNIDSSGKTVGESNINVKLAYVDTIAIGDTLTVANEEAKISIETPPRIHILNTVNIAPNTPYLNTSQDFQVRVDIENEGMDGAHGVLVMLNSNGNSFVTAIDTLSVEGTDTSSVYFNIKADSLVNFNEVFTAAVDTAIGDNTPEFDSIIIHQAGDDTAVAKIQFPAVVTITDVIPEQDTINALSKNWKIFVIVNRNDSAGWVQFDPPHKDSLKLFINGKVQTDYYITAPSAFKNSGGLMLSGWNSINDTLVYTIDQAGLLGGEATIQVALTGSYMNDNSGFVIQGTGEVYLQTTANLRIIATQPQCSHIEDGVGFLSTEQPFDVVVKITNSGEEPVDSVWISLSSDDLYHYPKRMMMINSISEKGQGEIEFPLLAKLDEQRVVFTASINSAKSRFSKKPAIIGASYDSLAVFQIQKKADLWVKFNHADTAMTIGEVSPIRFTVENSGTARIDSSGVVKITLPDDYKIMMGTKIDSEHVYINFIENKVDTLNIIPPNYVSYEKVPIIIEIKLPPPLDLNTGNPAYVNIDQGHHQDTIMVKTVPSVLNITTQITWPDGAKDGTVSTDQLFDLQSTFQISDNIKDVNTTLVLPDGYSFDTGEYSTKIIPSNNKVTWRLKAPTMDHASPKNLVVTGQGKVGKDEYSQNKSFPIIAVKKAELNLKNVGIIFPLETDSILSVNQNLTISATVVNEGDALVMGTGILIIDFGATGITTEEDTAKQFTVGNPVTWNAKAPSIVTGRNPVTIKIENAPNDVNTDTTAYHPGYRESFLVRTVQAGTVQINNNRITYPDGALDNILSTNQEFKITAEINWNNCKELPTVSIELPDGFDTEIKDKNPIGTSTQGIVTWTIKAPAERASNKNIWVVVKAKDAYSGANIEVISDNITLQVVNQAEIALNAEIFSPPDAMDGVVSTGQNFKIIANLMKYGDANLEDFYQVRLSLPSGQGYLTADTLTQRVLFSDQVTWTITAPLTARGASLFLVELVEPPHDANTSKGIEGEAIIEKSRAIPVTTEEKSITISRLPRRANNSLAKGDSIIPMLGLQFNCSGNEGSSKVLFDGVQLKLKDKYGNIISNPQTAISKISIVKYLVDSVVYGILSNIPASDSIYINFTRIDTLYPGVYNKIEFLVDIAKNASVTDFQIAIDSLYMIDSGSGMTPIFHLNSESLHSEFSVIVPQNFEKAFWNYPNPFGSSGRENTTIQYYLDQDCDIELRIFTLLGELVWSRRYSNYEPQGRKGLHDGASAIHWDARNEAGNIVLNGIYIARLATSYGKSAITKIAVLK